MRNWGDAAKADLTAGRTTAWTKGTTTTKLPVFLPDRWKFLWQSRMLEYCADHQSLHFPFLVLFSPLSSPPPLFWGSGRGVGGGGGGCGSALCLSTVAWRLLFPLRFDSYYQGFLFYWTVAIWAQKNPFPILKTWLLLPLSKHVHYFTSRIFSNYLGKWLKNILQSFYSTKRSS